MNRNPELANTLMGSLARASATQTPLTTIAADVASRFQEVSTKTIADYISALEKIFVVEDLAPFSLPL